MGGAASQAGGDDPANIAGPREHYVSCGAGWAHAQNTPLRRYKAWCHEGGIATPLIIRWPRQVAGGRMTHQPGHVIDVLPTLAAALEAEIPFSRDDRTLAPLEGRNLMPAIGDPDRQEPRKLFWAWEDNRAYRDGHWKIVWDQSVRRWELYDLETDRGESHDRSKDQPDRVAAMAKDWQSWADQTAASKRLGRMVKLKPE